MVATDPASSSPGAGSGCDPVADAAGAAPGDPGAGGPRAGDPEVDGLAADLLVWYDRHRRRLPWRAESGETPDPYRIWLSEVMLQQTTVAAVKPYFARFLALFPDVASLAGAPEEAVMSAWAGLGYYSRARNLHACAKAVVAAGGFPDTVEGLRKLPGIGAYTAGAIAAIAFDRSAAAVDGNVERVVSRLRAVEAPLPAARAHLRALAEALVPARRAGDFAQAVMDLGATICTPRRPACALCPWMRPCRARMEGLQETFPRKVRKVAGALRRGAAFVAVRAGDEAVLLRTRPPSGLLGAMAEPPTSEWRADYDPAQALLDAPLDARWRRLGTVQHGFTHFPLELIVFRARVAAGTPAPEGMRFTPRAALGDEPLPGAMKKVLAHALETPLAPSSPPGATRSPAPRRARTAPAAPPEIAPARSRGRVESREAPPRPATRPSSTPAPLLEALPAARIEGSAAAIPDPPTDSSADPPGDETASRESAARRPGGRARGGAREPVRKVVRKAPRKPARRP